MHINVHVSCVSQCGLLISCNKDTSTSCKVPSTIQVIKNTEINSTNLRDKTMNAMEVVGSCYGKLGTCIVDLSSMICSNDVIQFKVSF